MNNSINALIDFIGLSVLVLIYLSKKTTKKKEKSNKSVFKYLVISIFIILLTDGFLWLTDGINYPGGRYISITLNTIYYLMQIIFCRIWLYYVSFYINESNSTKKILLFFNSIPMILEICLIFLNLKTRWIFFINETNKYQRGIFYSYNLIPFYIYIFASMIVTIYYLIITKNTDKKRQIFILLIYMFFLIFGTIIQSLDYGISLLWPFTSIYLLLLFMNHQTQRIYKEKIDAAYEIEKADQMRNELADSRIRIMISQIQPSFLSDSLTIIKGLCTTEPKVAKIALENFSKYLRTNMDSLKIDKPIPFDQELQHTMHYLSLEKLKYKDQLSIEYNIMVNDFSIPALTLQPIVESIIHYVLMNASKKIILRISTFENDNLSLIKVEVKDTVFDLNEFNRGNNKTYLDNVKNRIKSMCNGNLQFNNNMSFIALITIPK